MHRNAPAAHLNGGLRETVDATLAELRTTLRLPDRRRLRSVRVAQRPPP